MTQVLVKAPETTEIDLRPTAKILPFDRGRQAVRAPSPTSSTTMVSGLLGMPPSALHSAAKVPASEVPGLLQELKILSLVLALAVAAGAVVTSIGIALTV